MGELKLEAFIRDVLLCGKFHFWSERQKTHKLKCFARQMKNTFKGETRKKVGKQHNLTTSAYFRGAAQLCLKAGFSSLVFSKCKKKKALLWKMKIVAAKLSML